MQLSEDEREGPFLLVAYETLDEVCAWLAMQGVRFREDKDASQTCAGPVVGVLRFEPDADRAALQALLDTYRP